MPPTDAATLDAKIADATAPPAPVEVPTPQSDASTSGETEEAIDLTDVATNQPSATPAKTPKSTEYVPTGQQKALGGKFATVDLRHHYVIITRQEGTPSIENRVEKIKTKQTVKNEKGEEETKVVEEDKPVRVIKYTYDNERVQQGDSEKSLTAALRKQKDLAKKYEDDGYRVFEKLASEYGVWYVEDPEGQKPGYRFTVDLVDAPAKPVKEPKVPKAPKEPKAAKEPKTASEAKQGKKGKKGDEATATAAAETEASKAVEVEVDDSAVE